MPVEFQIAIDADDPHAQAAFWAAAMDLEVEDHHDLVVQMVEQGYATEDDYEEVDGRYRWPDAACRSEDGRTRLLFQRVPEAKTVKNRVHLDLHVGAENRDAEVARLLDLGATRLWEGDQGPHHWVTLADPEGNEFCVA
jgi:predicted enzyme related to lactoylglutathione lyase